MRTIIAYLAVGIFFLAAFPFSLICLLIRVFNRPLAAKFAQAFIAFTFRPFAYAIGMRKTVLGRENIPKDTPVLYTSNHKSLLDAILAYLTLPNTTCFVSKKEIKKVPFLNLWMICLNCMFLDRDDLRSGLKVILASIEQIKAGTSVFISPEGTRSHTEEPLPFKEGSFKPAVKTGCPVIPVAITGTDEVYENHKPWIKKHRVIIEYGKPVLIKELPDEYKKIPAVYVREIIVSMLKEHKEL